MTRAFLELTRQALTDLADALEGGSLRPPYTAAGVRHFAARSDLAALASELTRFDRMGMTPSHVAAIARAVAAEREAQARAAAQVELVWTGPEMPGTASRDTLVVVGELFERARRSILVSGYNVWDGRSLFKKLIERAAAAPDLRVRMFLNIERRKDELGIARDRIVERFVDEFRQFHWSGARYPEVFYDPRSLDPEASAVLHAKCVVVDDDVALVTSANLTPAAQRRNIEAGVLLANPLFATQLRAQFERLVDAGVLCLVPGLS